MPTIHRNMDKLCGFFDPAVKELCKDMLEVSNRYRSLNDSSFIAATVEGTEDKYICLLSENVSDLIVSIGTIRELTDALIQLVDEIYTEFPETQPMSEDVVEEMAREADDPTPTLDPLLVTDEFG